MILTKLYKETKHIYSKKFNTKNENYVNLCKVAIGALCLFLVQKISIKKLNIMINKKSNKYKFM